jgi:hypothetical protein
MTESLACPPPLLACHIVAPLLLASWLWAKTWAIGSMRPVDMGVGVLMLVVTLKADLAFSGAHVRKRCMPS